MPELPEVETTRRGLEPVLVGRRIERLVVREPRLRWLVAASLPDTVRGQPIDSVSRRGKYLLINSTSGSQIVHLGMSGSLRYLSGNPPPLRHDHLDWLLDDGGLLRFNDPRRFGSLHYAERPLEHALLRTLGPEPLGDSFTADYLYASSRGRRCTIKQHIMNGRVVVGVGNIYASEALFRAGIRPATAAGRICGPRLARLVGSIRGVLEDALADGGTTLRDYVNADGMPGYFAQTLDVYDREGEPCHTCGQAIRKRVLGQRASFYCMHCQR